MGNYVCRTNRAETVDSIEPLSSNLVTSAPREAKKSSELVLFLSFLKIGLFYSKCGSKRYFIESTPYRVEHLMEMNKVELEEQIKHGWNPNDKSVNIFVKGRVQDK